MGEHDRSGWIKQRWSAIWTRGGRENEEVVREGSGKGEIQRLRQVPLPPLIGPPLHKIPDSAISTPDADIVLEVLKQGGKLPSHMHRMLVEATISFTTTIPDQIAAIIARIPETSYQHPLQRPLLDHYAFSMQQVLTLHGGVRQYMPYGQRTDVDITFVADRSPLRKTPTWSDPIIVLSRSLQNG